MENHIRRLRQARGWTMEELAGKVEGQPHFTTIAKLERSQRSLSTAWMEKLGKALGVPPEALITSNDGAPRRVPLIGQIAAGAWQEAIQDPMGWEWAVAGGPRTFALIPQGDSMNKLIPEGAYVLVDPDDLGLIDCKVYAVRNDAGEATIKRYRADDPRLEPVSDNDAHKPIMFGREAFTIIGRVVGFGKHM